MQGKIVKGISGFYYVFVEGTGIYECKAKGVFRNKKVKPLVGDNVEIAVIDEEKMLGNVEEILPRLNELIRPAVSNIDMALVIFAAAKPQPNFNLLDRFLCMMEYQKVPVTICFNKCDLVTEEERKALEDIYKPAGYDILFTSAKTKENIEELKALLKNKTTTVAGPSGVGKSSLINTLQDEIQMETGKISEKIERGKHTTRHSEIIPIGKGSYIMDTPGFSSMDVPGFEKEDLWTCYPEFVPHEPYCKFQGCSHISEPECGVKDALAEGKISPERYENYKLLYDELKNMKKKY
ncbi:MAG: ribosome small subunit-dependent GTPase A [Agathobacter sp.]|nr:ribosome small subunit-dependent GTPase A [Agathobacter sp.]